jgi:DNA polymerase
MQTASERREALKELLMAARACRRCAELAGTRTSVVFGAGNADAELMFVGEAPGANEDLQGLPFVGAAGKLLETLLGEIGLSRAEVFIANVLKCRPLGNRDPRPGEIENCTPYLVRQIELVAPRVVCTLGNFATKLLREDPAGITRVHGRAEVRTIGSHALRLYPLYHPAAALYTPRTLETLREDFHTIPSILALPPAPPRPAFAERPTDPLEEPPPVEPTAAAAAVAAAAPEAEQLGLF